MDRLAKKCVIASSVLHGTLVLVLLVGPAFVKSPDALAHRKVPTDDGEITLIPAKELEAGEPRPTPAHVSQTPPTHQPVPSVEAHKEEPNWKRSKQIDVNLEPVTRRVANADSTRGSATDNPVPAVDYERVISRINGQLSSPLQIKTSDRLHHDGVSDFGFQEALINAYWRAWLIPSEAADETYKVVVTITVRRDGTVISSSVQARSGNPALDASVQRALNAVTFITPLPESVKGAQKTFQLEFDPRAKRI
jgi:TonB family protein